MRPQGPGCRNNLEAVIQHRAEGPALGRAVQEVGMQPNLEARRVTFEAAQDWALVRHEKRRTRFELGDQARAELNRPVRSPIDIERDGSHGSNVASRQGCEWSV